MWSIRTVLRVLALAALTASAGPVGAAEDVEAQFAAAGFTPFRQVQAQGREVRRALFQDTFVQLTVQGVEFERHSGGKVTMTLVGPGLKPDPVPLPPATWTRLLAAEGRVFDTPRPLPDCPAWGLRLAATGPGGTRLTNVSGCVLGDPALEYARELTRLAVSTRADCVFDPDNPFWTFPDCFE